MIRSRLGAETGATDLGPAAFRPDTVVRDPVRRRERIRQIIKTLLTTPVQVGKNDTRHSPRGSLLLPRVGCSTAFRSVAWYRPQRRERTETFKGR
jgi:hypothetical protein